MLERSYKMSSLKDCIAVHSSVVKTHCWQLFSPRMPQFIPPAPGFQQFWGCSKSQGLLLKAVETITWKQLFFLNQVTRQEYPYVCFHFHITIQSKILRNFQYLVQLCFSWILVSSFVFSDLCFQICTIIWCQIWSSFRQLLAVTLGGRGPERQT